MPIVSLLCHDSIDGHGIHYAGMRGVALPHMKADTHAENSEAKNSLARISTTVFLGQVLRLVLLFIVIFHFYTTSVEGSAR